MARRPGRPDILYFYISRLALKTLLACLLAGFGPGVAESIAGHQRGALFTKSKKPGRVLKCKVTAKGKRKICLINTRSGKRGSRMNIYNRDQYLIGSGVILKRKKNRALIVLKHLRFPVKRGYLVQMNSGFLDDADWSSAFSNHSTEGSYH